MMLDLFELKQALEHDAAQRQPDTDKTQLMFDILRAIKWAEEALSQARSQAISNDVLASQQNLERAQSFIVDAIASLRGQP